MTALATQEAVHTGVSYRDAAAKRIKALMVSWTENTLALGRELYEARENFPQGPKPGHRMGFAKWAIGVTGLSNRQVNLLLAIHVKCGGHPGAHNLTQRIMKLLVHGATPVSARQEVLDRAERGEKVTHQDAAKAVKLHRYPSAKEANAQAKEEGRPVFARDGNIYFGTDPRHAKEGEDRRTMVYGVRKALETLGNIHLSGQQFLDYALPHQLWDADEAKVIKRALKWLTALDAAWDRR